MDADDDLLQFFGAREEVSGLDLELLVIARKAAGLDCASSRAPKLHDDGAGCKPVCRKPLSVEHDAQLPRLPADNRGFGNIVQLLQRMFELRRDSPQLVRIVVLAPKRQGEDRHIVNRAHFDSGCETPCGMRSKFE